MAILLMVVLVGLMLSALLVPMIITQNRATQFDTTRVQALNAAQSGIEVTTGLIRASVVNGIGISSRLPCGPESGFVNGAGVAAYSVVVEYFIFDPVTEPDPSDQAMKCVAGYGTFDRTGLTTPHFARITSTGTDRTTDGSTTGRTLTSTYAFRTADLNKLGGLLQLSSPTGSAVALCMDVRTPAAPAATALSVRPCSASNSPAAQQVFAYRTDLTLQLLSSISAANPNGLCLNSAHTPAVSGDAVQLFQCGPLGVPAAYTQQWSYNDDGQYQATQAESATTGVLPDLCMNVPTAAPEQAVILGECGSSWIPSPSVGPGAATVSQLGPGAKQWINTSEFGRCLDVTSQDPQHGYLIDYPCKQNPAPGAMTWNQLFQAPTVTEGQASTSGQISTNNAYCLTSPGINGGYVTVKSCDGGSRQTWTIYGGDNSLTYSTKYTLVNGSLCLGLSAPNAELAAWSTIDVETCTGATEQKWNAVPNQLNSALENTHER